MERELVARKAIVASPFQAAKREGLVGKAARQTKRRMLDLFMLGISRIA